MLHIIYDMCQHYYIFETRIRKITLPAFFIIHEFDYLSSTFSPFFHTFLKSLFAITILSASK